MIGSGHGFLDSLAVAGHPDGSGSVTGRIVLVAIAVVAVAAFTVLQLLARSRRWPARWRPQPAGWRHRERRTASCTQLPWSAQRPRDAWPS